MALLAWYLQAYKSMKTKKKSEISVDKASKMYYISSMKRNIKNTCAESKRCGHIVSMTNLFTILIIASELIGALRFYAPQYFEVLTAIKVCIDMPKEMIRQNIYLLN